MATPPQPNEDNKPLRIRRGRVESVDLYEIKDSELETFRRGSPADLHLNFAIFLLSLAATAIAALATATFTNDNIHTTFIVAAVVGVLGGVFLLISWFINRTPLTEVCDKIRQRIKETDLVITHVTAVEDVLPSRDPTEPKG